MSKALPPVSGPLVTDAMVKAGDAVLKRHDFSVWEKMTETEGHGLIREIIAAALSAMNEASPSGDRVVRVAIVSDILARFPCRAEPGSELDKLRRNEVAREIVAALAASNEPMRDEQIKLLAQSLTPNPYRSCDETERHIRTILEQGQ